MIEKYSLTPTEKYTSKWDAYHGLIPVSIKTKKINCALEMGDIFRQASIEEDFLIIAGFWSGVKTNIVKELILKIPASYWRSQFNQEVLSEYRDIFTGITNSKEDDDAWKERMTNAKSRWRELSPESIITPHFKRDHKTQKRIQCSIKSSAIPILAANYSFDLS